MSDEGKIIIKKDDETGSLGGTSDVSFKTAEQIEAMEKEAEKPVVDESKDESNDNTPDITSIDGTDYILDDKGNALKEDGSIFKTKDELTTDDNKKVIEDKEEEKTDDLVEINGTEYTLDKDGNAVLDGEIKFTKDDISDMEAENSTPSININNISKAATLEIYDNTGTPIEYENTEEGVVSYVNDVYVKGNNDAINSLYQSHPEIEQLYNHLQLGGSMDNFNSSINYSNVTLHKENEAQLKDIIYKAQTQRGNRIEAIDRTYNALKAGDTDNDNLYEEASIELKYLQDNEKEAKIKQEAILKQQELDSQIETNNYWGVENQNGNLVDLNNDNSIYSIVKSGKLKLKDKTWQIPEKTKVVRNGKTSLLSRDEVFGYLYNPIVVNVNGNRVTTTQAEYDRQVELSNRTPANDIFEAYRRLVNYDDSQFITEQVNKSNVKRIRKLTTKLKSKSSTNAINASSNSKNKIIFKRN